MKKKSIIISILSLSLMLGACSNETPSENQSNTIENQENEKIEDKDKDNKEEEKKTSEDEKDEKQDSEEDNKENDDSENDEEDNKDDNPPVEIKSYTITWNNFDNSLLSSTTVKEGKMPVYNGVPTRPETDDYTYTFSGWEPAISLANSNATYTATYTETIKDKPLEISSIADVRKLCENVKNLNSAGIGIDFNVKVRIQGWAFHKMTLVKTLSKYGYDESFPNKVFLGDSTGFIACASNNNPGSLYYKVNDYDGNAKSKYDVIGYVSMYMNQPELYVPNNDTENYFTYNENLNVSCDFDTIAKTKTIEEYYNDFSSICYNCAGHGYKDIVRINNVSIVDVVDSDTYIGTDGDKVIKIKKGISGLAKGRSYNIIGLVQINDYIPSLNILSSSNSDKEFSNLNENSVVSTPISDFINTFYSLPFDDTNKNMADVIKKFQYIYKVSGYVSGYSKNGKLYVTLEPNFNDSKEYPTRENSVFIRNSITFKNDNLWNTTEEKVIKFTNIGGYLNENVPVSTYITPILYENMKNNSSGKRYHELKNYIFDDLVPEFVEE